MTDRTIRILLPVFLLIAWQPAFAEELLLKNGDRLTGKIVARSEEEVVIETPYAGRIAVMSSFIEKIGEEESMNEAPAASGPKTDAPSGPPAEARLASAAKPVGRLIGGDRYYGLVDGWEGSANIGFSYTNGNSRTATMSSGIRAVKTGGDDKLTIYGRNLWNTNRSSGRQVTTQNAVWGGVRYDRDVNDRIFAFGSFDFERDRPKRLNFRSVLGGGLGHRTVKNERAELEILVGSAWNRTWQAGPNTDTPEALAGNTLKFKFHDRLRLQQTFTYFQNFTDKNESRFLFDTTLTADLTKRIGWQFTIGDRFNNDPPGNAKRNDFLFTTGLRWNFGRKK